ncbi:Ig-like domain-containing protein [Weissella paramesenteroides]|uniref:Ig-like domain-containing protein n=1 Tax=Weissella paramesenteroides TaxID=1249 RepID=UPI001EE2E72F|nr:Ig-like domain-containing protein [Weissella paramesenteroides]
MVQTFDLYKDDKIVQAGVTSPIEIDGLTPNTQYDNFELAYKGKVDKTQLSFKTMVQLVTGISLDKTTLALDTGSNATLKAAVDPTDATNKVVVWSSDNTAVATVDNAGKVTAVKAGTANITAKTDDQGKTAVTKVTVTDPAPAE